MNELLEEILGNKIEAEHSVLKVIRSVLGMATVANAVGKAQDKGITNVLENIKDKDVAKAVGYLQHGEIPAVTIIQTALDNVHMSFKNSNKIIRDALEIPQEMQTPTEAGEKGGTKFIATVLAKIVSKIKKVEYVVVSKPAYEPTMDPTTQENMWNYRDETIVYDLPGRVAEIIERNTKYSTLAEIIADALDITPVATFKLKDEVADKIAGATVLRPDGPKILIADNAWNVDRKILHEAIHALTLGAITNPTTEADRNLIARLTPLYERYKQEYNITAAEFDLAEFVANLSNDTFMENARKIKVGKKSLWNQIIEAILDWLGLDETDVYEATLASFEMFLEEKAFESPDDAGEDWGDFVQRLAAQDAPSGLSRTLGKIILGEYNPVVAHQIVKTIFNLPYKQNEKWIEPLMRMLYEDSINVDDTSLSSFLHTLRAINYIEENGGNFIIQQDLVNQAITKL